MIDRKELSARIDKETKMNFCDDEEFYNDESALESLRERVAKIEMLSRSIDSVDETSRCQKNICLQFQNLMPSQILYPIHLKVEKHNLLNKVSKRAAQNIKWEGAMTFVVNMLAIASRVKSVLVYVK